MEIRKQIGTEKVEFSISGRLDAYWSDHLSGEISSAIRSGIHHVRLNLLELHYISSAGIRVLLNFYQQLKAIHGSLIVSQISEPARAVLELAGLMEFLSPAEAETAVLQAPGRKIASENGSYEAYSLKESGFFRCKILGDPALLEGCKFNATHARRIALTSSTFGLGLGAFGQNYEECKGRFGEFLAVAGSAAYLPTDGTNIPDYLITSGKFIPELMVLYGIFCEGVWKNLLRFEARDIGAGSLRLSEILSCAFDFLNKDTLAIAMICENEGLVGAALTKTPVDGASPAAPFRYPETVDWLSFTTDRAFGHSLSLVAGVATIRRDPHPVLRWLDRDEKIAGHFHAAAFPYRPLKKGRMEINEAVSSLFEAGRVEGVLHLIQDDREIGGSGESEFIRGACWISPVTEWLGE